MTYSGISWSGIGSSSAVFSEAQIQEGVALYRKIVSIPDDVQKKLHIPLERWVKSKTNQGFVDKIIDLLW